MKACVLACGITTFSFAFPSHATVYLPQSEFPCKLQYKNEQGKFALNKLPSEIKIKIGASNNNNMIYRGKKVVFGSCAKLIIEANDGFIKLQTGEVLAFDSVNSQVLQHSSQQDIPAYLLSTAKISAQPTLHGYQSHGALELGRSRLGKSTKTDFVGIWRKGHTSLVGTFFLTPDNTASAVKALLLSERPITNVSYEPAADAYSGTLYLISPRDKYETEIIRLTWDHSNMSK